MAVTGTHQLAPGVRTNNARPELDLGAEAMRKRTLLKFVEEHRESLDLDDDAWKDIQQLPKDDEKGPSLVKFIETNQQMGKLPPFRRKSENQSEISELKDQLAKQQQMIDQLLAMQGGVSTDATPPTVKEKTEPWADVENVRTEDLIWGDLRKRALNLYGIKTHGMSKEHIIEACNNAQAGGEMADKDFHNA